MTYNLLRGILWDDLRVYVSAYKINIYKSIIYSYLWRRGGDSIRAGGANLLAISDLVHISFAFNHLHCFSTVVLRFNSFSYGLFFRKKQYHWYH